MTSLLGLETRPGLGVKRSEPRWRESHFLTYDPNSTWRARALDLGLHNTTVFPPSVLSTH